MGEGLGLEAASAAVTRAAGWPSVAAVERELYPTIGQMYAELARPTPPAYAENARRAARVEDSGDDGDNDETV